MEEDVIEIRVKNWDKFNQRNDRQSSTWFRMNHDLFGSRDCLDFTPSSYTLWLYILSTSSQDNTEVIRISPRHCRKVAGLKTKDIQRDLLKFEQLQWIEILSSKALLQPTTPTNVTNVTNERNVYEKKARRRRPKEKSDTEPTLGSRVRDAFISAYRSEFHRDYPGWGAKEAAQALNWLRSVSVERAIELCWLYPKWNDPWVTEQGHPFGVLVTQYVKLDAWAKSSTKLIAKIAQGKAAQKVDLERAVHFEEMRRGMESRTAGASGPKQAPQDLGHHRSVQGQLPKPAPAGLPRIADDPFGEEVFNPPSENRDGTSG
jgi:hypothetical protein